MTKASQTSHHLFRMHLITTTRQVGSRAHCAAVGRQSVSRGSFGPVKPVYSSRMFLHASMIRPYAPCSYPSCPHVMAMQHCFLQVTRRHFLLGQRLKAPPLLRQTTRASLPVRSQAPRPKVLAAPPLCRTPRTVSPPLCHKTKQPHLTLMVAMMAWALVQSPASSLVS